MVNQLKERYIHSFPLALFFFMTNIGLFLVTTKHNMDVYFILSTIIALFCAFCIYRDLKLLISATEDFSALKAKFDLVMFFLPVVIIFNGNMALFDFSQQNLTFSKILFLFVCVVPIYLLFTALSIHLLFVHRKLKKRLVTVYFSSMVVFAIFANSLLFANIANILLSVCYVLLSFVIQYYAKRKSIQVVS